VKVLGVTAKRSCLFMVPRTMMTIKYSKRQKALYSLMHLVQDARLPIARCTGLFG